MTTDLILKGNRVVCRYYNEQDGEYYGGEWTAEVLEVDPEHLHGHFPHPFKVTEPVLGTVWLKRKEILR